MSDRRYFRFPLRRRLRSGSAEIRGLQGLIAADILANAAAFVANLASSRTLGPFGRGQVALLLQASYLLAVFAILGRDRGYPAVARNPSGWGAVRDQVAGFRLPILIAAAGSIAFVALLGSRLRLTWLDAVVLVGLVAAALSWRLARAAAIASRATSVFLVAAVASQVLLVGICLVLWILDSENVRYWELAYLVGGFLPFALLAVVSLWKAPRRAGFQVASMGLTVATLAEILLMRADRLLLPLFGNYHELGLYVSVAAMTEIATLPVLQFADASVKRWASGAASLRSSFRQCAYALLVGLALSALAAPVIAVSLVPLFGAEFAPAKSLILPLSAAAVAAVAFRLVMSVCIAYQANRATVFQGMAGLLVVAVAYPPAISHAGALGAALASTFALAASATTGAVSLIYWLRHQRTPESVIPVDQL